jgi:hypothetical protein
MERPLSPKIYNIHNPLETATPVSPTALETATPVSPTALETATPVSPTARRTIVMAENRSNPPTKPTQTRGAFISVGYYGYIC